MCLNILLCQFGQFPAGYGFSAWFVTFFGISLSIHPVNFILNLILAGFGVTLFSIAAFSLGLGVLRWQEVSLVRGVTAFALGEVLFSLVFLAVISFTPLTPLIVCGLLISGFLLGLPILLHWKSAFSNVHFSVKYEGSEKTTFILAFIILSLTVFLATTRLSYDAAVEYFSQAKIWAVTGDRILLFPNDPFQASSLHPTILFTPLIQLFGDQSARLLSWVNGLVLVLLGLVFGKKLKLSSNARLWFVVLLLSSTFFIDLFGDGKIELIVTLPLLVAAYWMLEGLERPLTSSFLLVGLLTGFAIISRAYNIFLVPLYFALFFAFSIVSFIRSHPFRSQFPSFSFNFSGISSRPFLDSSAADPSRNFPLMAKLPLVGQSIRSSHSHP